MSIVLMGSTSGSITLQEPAVAGSTVLDLPARSGTIMVNGPAFSAYGSGSQTVATATYTKLPYNTEVFDTNSNYDTTNYRFTPTVAGYYQINANAAFGAAASGYALLVTYKNGALDANLNSTSLSTTNSLNIGGSVLVYLNGTTDYVEIYAYQTSGGNLTVTLTTSTRIFSGCLLRGA